MYRRYMPSDLFINDIENIKLMFAFNKYRVEEIKAYDEWNGYNQKRVTGKEWIIYGIEEK